MRPCVAPPQCQACHSLPLPLHLPLCPVTPKLRLPCLHQSLHANAVRFPPLTPTPTTAWSSSAAGVLIVPTVLDLQPYILRVALRQGDDVEKTGSIQHNLGKDPSERPPLPTTRLVIWGRENRNYKTQHQQNSSPLRVSFALIFRA